MKIGVYVGSFNPPHLGHKKIINHLLDNYLDKVIIVPTGSYWEKNNLIDIKDRIKMLKFYETKNIIIDEENNHLPYTYQVLENLEKKYQEELYLIIGADNLINFDKWKNFNTLLKYNLIIMNREDIDAKYYQKKHHITKGHIINDFPKQDVSSTIIRDLLKNKKYKESEIYLDKNVLEYVKINNLYQEND